MAKKEINTTPLDGYGKKKKAAELQKEQPATTDSPKKKVITLEITDEQDYLDLMAKHEGIPRTKYIRNLIKADQEKNLQRYEALKLLRDLEK